MRSIQVLLLLAMAVFSSASFAADQGHSRSSSVEAAQPSQPTIIFSDSDALPYSGLTNTRESGVSDARWDRKPSWHLHLNPARDVCYTMRMYKVKATERLNENETGTRGFSTCQFARDYQLRSADMRDDDRSTTASGTK
ncbi:MAG TPA: hypothetical protein VGL74_11600 [Terriglobales bacterium]